MAINLGTLYWVGPGDFVRMNTDLESLEARICDNCGAEVVGRFCHVCGQNAKNYESSLWRVIGDILREQFDLQSRATRTFKSLVLHPGLLAVEFKANRRASYVSPIRMYLFSSLLFFFLVALSPSDQSARVFSFSVDTNSYSLQSQENEVEESDPSTDVNDEESAFQFQETQRKSEDFADDIEPVRQLLDDRTNQLISEILIRTEDSPSRQLLLGHLVRLGDKEEPSGIDWWITPLVVKILHDFSRLVEDVKNNLALIMVILLPWMVLTSALLNIGKHVRLVHQLVFWMHMFTFAFLILSFELLVVRFALKGFWWTGFVTLATYLLLLVHSYMAFHKFYGGGHLAGIFKFFLLLMVYFVALLVAFFAVVALSIYNL